jgi:hypothetical protein
MAVGRIYTVTWDAATSITVALDAFEITPAAEKHIYIHELKLWQEGAADVGDVAEEILGVSIIRGFTTSGSGGAAGAVGKQMGGDAAAGFAAEVRNTTLATTGTTEKIDTDGFNVRVPYIWTPIPEDRPHCSLTQTRIVVRLTAPADAIILNGSLKVEEQG